MGFYASHRSMDTPFDMTAFDMTAFDMAAFDMAARTLPDTLASAHAMILAQRQMLEAGRNCCWRAAN